ncbi:MAG: hypothetical protein ACTS80_01710 [Candidatus Hodgkinia cicadicola]
MLTSFRVKFANRSHRGLQSNSESVRSILSSLRYLAAFCGIPVPSEFEAAVSLRFQRTDCALAHYHFNRERRSLGGLYRRL